MISTAVTRDVAARPTRPQVQPPRVRDQARDAVSVMAFSATTSIVVTAALVLLAHLGR